nr:DUF3606 domain-containing protein [uncultured Mucilaginibacter sp.]
MENKKLSQAEDNRGINLGDDHLIEYWTGELKATKSKLLVAIAEVGDQCELVKKQLKRF